MTPSNTVNLEARRVSLTLVSTREMPPEPRLYPQPKQTESSVPGEPNLRKVAYPSGKVRYFVSYRDPVTGLRNKVKLADTPIDETEARVLARQVRKDLQAGMRPAAGNQTLSAYFHDAYLKHARQEKKSWRDDLGRFVQHIEPRIGHKRLRDLTTRDLESVLDALRKGAVPTRRRERLSDGSIYLVAALQRAICKHAFKHGVIRTNIGKGIELKPLHNQRSEIYSAEELATLLPKLQTISRPAANLLRLTLATSCRTGELLNLQVKDIDEAQGLIRLGKTKSGRPHVVPLSPEGLLVLRDQLAVAKLGNPYLFPATRGSGPMSTPRKALNSALQKLGLGHRTFHDGRRTALTTAVHAPGVTLLDASRLANHASVKVTEAHYVVTSTDRLRAVVKAIGQALPIRAGVPLRIKPMGRSLVVDTRIQFITAG